jgi:ribose transport system substrate-binding protein
MKFRKVYTALALGAASTLALGIPGAAFSAPSAAPGGPSVALSEYKGVEAALPTHYAEPKPGAVKSFTIGFMNPSGGNQNLQAVQDAAQAETKRLGGRFIAKNDNVDINTQLNNFKQLLVQGADAILLYPLDPKALGPAIKQAKEKGVVVIGYDVTNQASDALPEGYVSPVMQGRDWQAWSMAKAMASAKPGGQIGLIGFAVPVPGIEYLVQRVKYWSEQMGLKVVGRQDNREDSAAGGKVAATALLGANPQLAGIIAYNDPSAAGAAAAARIAGRHISIVGMNGDDFGVQGVKKGTITATFQNDAVGQGVQGVIGAYDVLAGIKVPKAIVRPPSATITASTVKGVKSWSQQLAELGRSGD